MIVDRYPEACEILHVSPSSHYEATDANGASHCLLRGLRTSINHHIIDIAIQSLEYEFEDFTISAYSRF